MECLLGLAFKDFVLIAADMTCANSVIVMKDDADKLHKISDNLVMAICGESGDTTQFAEYIAKNVQLYKMRNGYGLSPKATAHYTQRNLADYLRSRTPYNVNMLIAGHDKDGGAELYYIDYLASLVKAPYISYGYGGIFALGIMDRYYRPDMSVEEGYDILKKCVKEVQKRLLVNLPNFKVQVIDKNGIRDLPKLKSIEINA
uniref:Proteasome subunit beta n=1 Tax=Clastoptera arizonana TaxID=38151 RepID=A0A1B6E889_9HEMI